MRRVLVWFGLLLACGGLVCGYRCHADLSELEKAFEVAHDLDDENLIVIDSVLSPDQNHVYYHYQFDRGSLGYSRAYWAVIERDASQRKLMDGLLPDDYRAIGWTENSEWIVEPPNPGSTTFEEMILRSGDMINGVPLKIQSHTPR